MNRLVAGLIVVLLVGLVAVPRWYGALLLREKATTLDPAGSWQGPEIRHGWRVSAEQRLPLAFSWRDIGFRLRGGEVTFVPSGLAPATRLWLNGTTIDLVLGVDPGGRLPEFPLPLALHTDDALLTLAPAGGPPLFRLRGVNLSLVVPRARRAGVLAEGSFSARDLRIGDWLFPTVTGAIFVERDIIRFERLRIHNSREVVSGEAAIRLDGTKSQITWAFEIGSVDVMSRLALPTRSAGWPERLVLALAQWGSRITDPDRFIAKLSMEGTVPDLDASRLQGRAVFSMSETQVEQTAIVSALERALQVELSTRRLQPVAMQLEMQGSRLLVSPTPFVIEGAALCLRGKLETSYFDRMALELFVRVRESQAKVLARILGLPDDLLQLLADNQGSFIFPYRATGPLGNPLVEEAIDEDGLNDATRHAVDNRLSDGCWPS